MRGPIAVRISDGLVDRTVPARRVKGLRFTKTAPGGHHSASMRIGLSLDDFDRLTPNDRIYIYDTRTGRTLWDGYTDNPGAVDGSGGQGFELSAMGGMALASDQSERLIYLDRSLEQWRRCDNLAQAASGTGEVSIFPSDAGSRAGQAALNCQFNPGQPINNGFQTGVIYDAFAGSSMTLAAFVGFYDAGLTDANYTLSWVVGPSPATTLHSVSMSATGSDVKKFETDDFAAGFTNLVFRLVRGAGGATTVATDTVWACYGEVIVLGHLVDRDGALRDMSVVSHVTTATVPASGYILASEVAEDLLGRLLTFCDPTTATIDTTAAEIDQLTYHDGATAAQVFEDLALHEPNFYWGIGETLQNGLHRFWFREWPTTARYEISTKDGYSAPGGDVDLCNRIAVYWTDDKGTKQTTIRTSTVEELGSRIRDAESITLPDGQGSLENAVRIGDEVLAAKADPPKAATATVRRKILDLERGGAVAPWEIDPGCLVRVRETGDVLRLTEVEYVDDDCTATLTLGEPVLTIDQRIARLSTRR